MSEAAREIEERDSGLSKIVSSIILAIVAAIIGYIFTYLEDQRKVKINFVNTQIERLYGPLFSIMQANDIAWSHFHNTYWPDRKDYFEINKKLTPKEIELYRRWMRTVFQPMNIKMEDTIVSNAQLLIGNRMPTVFLQFISHTEAYKAVMSNWKEGSDITDADVTPELNMAPILWPKTFSDCVSSQFRLLKETQQRLEKQIISWSSEAIQEVPKECIIEINLKHL